LPFTMLLKVYNRPVPNIKKMYTTLHTIIYDQNLLSAIAAII
jgi:hypothetical protein